METAPRNCRFLSVVVVERVLREKERTAKMHPRSREMGNMWTISEKKAALSCMATGDMELGYFGGG